MTGRGQEYRPQLPAQKIKNLLQGISFFQHSHSGRGFYMRKRLAQLSGRSVSHRPAIANQTWRV